MMFQNAQIVSLNVFKNKISKKAKISAIRLPSEPEIELDLIDFFGEKRRKKKF